MNFAVFLSTGTPSLQPIVSIPRGGLALTTVTEAQHKRRMARGGKLDVNIDDVRLSDGEKALLRAVKEAEGGGHTLQFQHGDAVSEGSLDTSCKAFCVFRSCSKRNSSSAA